MTRHREGGFTLIELLFGMLLMAILLGLGANAMRSFWFHRALSGGQDEIVSQFRQLQQRAITASHPLVYGARIKNDSATMGLVEYDPVANTCKQYSSVVFDAGVVVKESSFSNIRDVNRTCRTQLSSGGDEYVFFFARGTATDGSITLRQPRLNDRTRTVSVSALTGRVEAE